MWLGSEIPHFRVGNELRMVPLACWSSEKSSITGQKIKISSTWPQFGALPNCLNFGEFLGLLSFPPGPSLPLIHKVLFFFNTFTWEITRDISPAVFTPLQDQRGNADATGLFLGGGQTSNVGSGGEGRDGDDVRSNMRKFLTPTKIKVVKIGEQHFLTWQESSREHPWKVFGWFVTCRS